MKEQIKAILRDQVSINSTKSLNEIANELENLYYRTYLNECIAKAEPNLSKIKDVDKELAEIQGQAWICPRCQKVHSWMVQSCDCYPSVITASTTEPIKELAKIKGEGKCESCKYFDGDIEGTPCENCFCQIYWEPKTE